MISCSLKWECAAIIWHVSFAAESGVLRDGVLARTGDLSGLWLPDWIARRELSSDFVLLKGEKMFCSQNVVWPI